MARSDISTRSGDGLTGGDVLRLILAVVLPPLGVFTQVGFGLHFWLNILLTLLGYIPGIIHAVWIIATRR
ncbi:MAG: YqaE/Pmp3 family membrane protein [Oceanicaulis sp.]